MQDNDVGKMRCTQYDADGNYYYQIFDNIPIESFNKLGEFIGRIHRMGFIYDEFTKVYFTDYGNNPVLAQWLVHTVPVLEAGTMLHRLKSGMRYYTRGFAEYREFDNIEAFMQHRFELWHDEVVAEFEKAITNGTATCTDCEKGAN